MDELSKQIVEFFDENQGMFVNIKKSLIKQYLSQEEYKSLCYVAIWKGIRTHNPTKSKLITHIYYQFMAECAEYLRLHKPIAANDLRGCEKQAKVYKSIDDLIESCNPTMKKMLKFRYEDGMTCSEIAKRFNCSNQKIHDNIKTELKRLCTLLSSSRGTISRIRN